MSAAQFKLDNLVAIVDNNNLQIDGELEEVMSPYPIAEKFQAFGWHVIEVNGHDYDELFAAYKEAKTIKGKGVSYMENQCGWHGSAPNAEQCELALKELEA